MLKEKSVIKGKVRKTVEERSNPTGKSRTSAVVRETIVQTRPRTGEPNPPPRRKERVQSKVAPPPRPEPSFIVGIGASAGGLDAFSTLLSKVPIDTGMAFVVVQHLDPTKSSALSEILGKVTAMPVVDAKDKARLEPDHVYVAPPNVILTIEHGTFKSVLGSEEPGRHRGIDIFLQSLAQERKSRAIGIVLSGSAWDGTAGLAAIKAEGGITFAQDEKSAGYSSMPRNAAASGAVDFILPPGEIGEELGLIAAHASTAEPAEEEATQAALSLADDGHSAILNLLRSRTGLDPSLYKPTTLKRRIARRMMVHKIVRPADYEVYLRDHPEEVELLYQDILINVTSFFRDPETFEFLQERIFPKLMTNRPARDVLRTWVIGCSTGQEPYSLAMAYLEFAAQTGTQVPLQIFATDVNEKVLEKARVGLYSKSQMQDVSRERLARFFVEESGGYRISQAVRELCVFSRHNIASDSPFSRMDLVSCRNLFIYFDPMLNKKLAPVLFQALKPGGFLLLGRSETIVDPVEFFVMENRSHRIYSKKVETVPPHAQLPPGATPILDRPNLSEHLGARISPGTESDAQKEADRVALAHYAPAGVLINREMQIVQFRGKTGPYLEPVAGTAHYHFLKMLRAGLILPVRTALEQAQRQSEAVRVEGVDFECDDQTRSVDVEVVPLTNLKEPYFLVCFEPTERNERARRDRSVPRAARNKKALSESHRLRGEIALLKEDLQSLTERSEAATQELQSASEEAQSANEELRSINEELQTTKEELESTNEELITVNEEMNSRNLELNQINSDLNNVLAGVQICVVVLDNDLRIRHFTELAKRLLNLVPSDQGRPLTNINPNIDFPALETVIRETIRTSRPHDQEIQDNEGRWYSMRVMPYRTDANVIAGAVLTLVDIDAAKRSEQRIRTAKDEAEAIVETVREPLLILTPGLRVERANRAFYDTFRAAPQETIGYFLDTLGAGQWAIPQLTTELQKVIADNAPFDDFEVQQNFERLGPRTMLLNARLLAGENRDGARILLAIEDISERRQLEVLRDSEQRFRTLAEALPQLVWTCSPEGECDYFNATWTQFTGLSTEQLLGMKWRQVLHPTDRERTCDYWWKALKGGVPYDLEYRIRRSDGQYHWFKVRATPLKDAQGNITKWFGTSTDIDELQQSHDALERIVAERTTQLREMVTELESFSYTVSHDLRAPLRAMAGFASFVIEDIGEGLTPTAKDYLERIIAAANRQDRLIQDVLAYSRVLRSEIRLAPLDLDGLIEDVVQQYSGFRAPQVQIEIVSPLLPVLAHGPSLTQAVANLVSNAVKFVPPGTVPHLKIWTEPVGDQVRVWFEDNGIGIAPADRERIFNMFERVQSNQRFEGTGIGLSIVRKAIERMGGSLGVESERGKGSRFWLQLKTREADDQSETPPPSEDTGSGSDRIRSDAPPTETPAPDSSGH